MNMLIVFLICLKILIYSNVDARLKPEEIEDLHYKLRLTKLSIDSLLNVRRGVYEHSRSLATRIDSLKEKGDLHTKDLVTEKLIALPVGDRLEEIDNRLKANRSIEDSIKYSLCEAHDEEMGVLLQLLEDSVIEDGRIDVGLDVLFVTIQNKRDSLGDCFTYENLSFYQDVSVEEADSPDDIRLKLALLDHAGKVIQQRLKRIKKRLVRMNERSEKIGWIIGSQDPYSKERAIAEKPDISHIAKYGNRTEERKNAIESQGIGGFRTILEDRVQGFLRLRIKKIGIRKEELLRIKSFTKMKEKQLEHVLSHMLQND